MAVCTLYLSKGPIKYVHGTVVTVTLHILDIVLHLHFHRVAIIVLTTLESLVSIFPDQPLKKKQTNLFTADGDVTQLEDDAEQYPTLGGHS